MVNARVLGNDKKERPTKQKRKTYTFKLQKYE